MCHSNCPFSTATPGHIWTELLYALLHILLSHHTRKQHLREPQMPSHKALSPAEMLSTVQGFASITYAESSTNENSYTENKNVPQRPQQEREGGEQEDYTYARSKALYPVVRPTWYSTKRNLVAQWGSPNLLGRQRPTASPGTTFAAAHGNSHYAAPLVPDNNTRRAHNAGSLDDSCEAETGRSWN